MSYKYAKWLLKLSFFEVILYFEIWNEVISGIFPIVAWLTGAGDVFGATRREPLMEDIILSIIIAPVTESFIAQWLPYVILRYFTKNLYFIYFFSASVFAIGHTYNNWYMTATFFIGQIFIALFTILAKKSLHHAFWGVTIVHAISNTFAVIYEHW